MKKIGILFGMEDTYPQAFIDRVNSKNEKGIIAEAVSIDKVVQNKDGEYAVIIDRISQDVPFYRAYLKNAALTGTNVINNPFWWSADDKFFISRYTWSTVTQYGFTAFCRTSNRYNWEVIQKLKIPNGLGRNI